MLTVGRPLDSVEPDGTRLKNNVKRADHKADDEGETEEQNHLSEGDVFKDVKGCLLDNGIWAHVGTQALWLNPGLCLSRVTKGGDGGGGTKGVV